MLPATCRKKNYLKLWDPSDLSTVNDWSAFTPGPFDTLGYQIQLFLVFLLDTFLQCPVTLTNLWTGRHKLFPLQRTFTDRTRESELTLTSSTSPIGHTPLGTELSTTSTTSPCFKFAWLRVNGPARSWRSGMYSARQRLQNCSARNDALLQLFLLNQ